MGPLGSALSLKRRTHANLLDTDCIAIVGCQHVVGGVGGAAVGALGSAPPLPPRPQHPAHPRRGQPRCWPLPHPFFPINHDLQVSDGRNCLSPAVKPHCSLELQLRSSAALGIGFPAAWPVCLRVWDTAGGALAEEQPFSAHPCYDTVTRRLVSFGNGIRNGEGADPEI